MNRPGPVRVAAKPRKMEIALLFVQAFNLQKDGRVDEAVDHYRQVLRRRPDHFDTLHMLGICEHRRKNHEAAAQFIRRALMVDRKAAAAHSNLAAVLVAMNRFDEAVTACDKAIALDLNQSDAHHNRGTALNALKRYAEAVEAYDRYLASNPNHMEALNNRGSALHELGRYEEAVESFDRALSLNPQHALAIINRGCSLKELRQLEEALDHFDRGLALAPGLARYWSDRADVLLALGKGPEALVSYDKGLGIDPNLPQAWFGRANILLLWNKLSDAEVSCRQALAIDPKCAQAHIHIATLHSMQGRPEAAIDCLDEALSCKPGDEIALSNKIFLLDLSPKADAALQQRTRAEWWEQVGRKIFERSARTHDNDRDPDRKLVLGYVSGDFNHRSPAYATRPVLRHHDKSRFEVVCYSMSPTNDAVTQSFREVADRWRDVVQWSDAQFLEGIRADKIDILIDLSGHTAGNRLRTFAAKPAPVQVTAWGFGTGSGLRSIDYLLSDPVALPAEERHLYAEEVVDLPSLMIMDPPPAELRCPEPPILANGYLTYGVFNRVSKISDAAVALWARILLADPSAHLIIKDQSIDNPSVQTMLLDRFGPQGIGPERITFMGNTPRDEHLKAYGKIDVCLDPFPQNGGISTWEALHMGVPVVSALGTTVASRCAAAILSAVGLTDWVAHDDGQYMEIARAATAERLTALRGALPAMIAERCSPEAYTRAVEDAYRTMWHRYCRTAAA